MEYMNIEGFFGGAISKVVNKGVENKFGVNPYISINKMNMSTSDEDNKVKVELTVTMAKKDFERIIEEATK